MNLDKAVKVLCAMHGITRKELAAIMVMSESGFIQAVKKETLKLCTIKHMCSYFDITLTEFIALGECK